MQLATALRLSESFCLAIVGAGGKTTALFTLARQLSPPVFVTTTTHLSVAQLALADRHVYLEQPADLDVLESLPSNEVIAFTGPIVEQGRVAGLESGLLERLRLFAANKKIPLLIEADGSRQKPLKAPATHEPAIPSFVDTLVVVAGLSALGKPLISDWVHRPELFSELSGLELSEVINLGAISRVLLHSQGGLKHAPPQARRIALLNQAETAERQAGAQRIAQNVLSGYHAVVVAQLGSLTAFLEGQAFDKQVFLEDASGATVHAVWERVAGVILAAGESLRLGRPKQLLDWQGRPFVRAVALTALEAGLNPVAVVTGANSDLVSQAVADLPVELVYNKDWSAGQSSSIRYGLESLPPETGGAVFLLSDQPQIPVTLVRSLLDLHATTLSPVVAPLVDGRRANPVLFDRQTFADLMNLSGDVGGRAIFSRYPVTWLEWHDPSVLLDVDTQQDYMRLMDLES